MATILTGSFVSDGTQFNLALRSGYDMFQLVNITDVGSTAANTNIMRAWASSLMPDGSAYLNTKTSGAATLALESMITTAGFTFWDSGNPPTFAVKTVIGGTQASPVVINVTAHGYAVGDTVMFKNLTGGGSESLSGLQFTVIAVGDADHFTIPFDGAVGLTGAITGGSVTKIIPNPFAPRNIVIGQTALATLNGVANQLTFNLNEAILNGTSNLMFGTYSVGAKLRINIPTSFNPTTPFLPTTINSQIGTITAVTAQAGYNSFANQVTVQLSTPIAASTLLQYPVGAANFKRTYPFVSDIAEVSTILSEAEDNKGFLGITIGTGVQTTGKLYQWFARKGYTL